jgi:hypothetical protein
MNFISYLLIGVIVVAINHLIIYKFIKNDKQAKIFMISKFVIAVFVGAFALVFLIKTEIFKLASSFVLAMFIHFPPKN